ncbi:hypothetical protein J3L18_31000 [Mucilaginibacter gossypii]|uniref:hypothetical protein n=1 Tax=Mucilaginibacter gossypii TaxID=551996 RepID=UPI000DCF532F|nr:MULTISPECIES: hypothetical protein [Mucilaginibacter]QTE37476.1 hypothetical protein J3L18_31000 [Mucilaginibacter gossypii]RAV52302.1 hypothetical protein DIU36_24515 [Mucilaginibacter rubeus]
MSSISRFTGLPQDDNTDRILKNDFQTPAFAATVAIVVKGSVARTIIKPATLTGVVTFSINVADPLTNDANNGPFVGDGVEFYLTPDGTTRVVTFGTGFLPTGTLSVTTAKYAYIAFRFNGTGWVESGRSVSA